MLKYISRRVLILIPVLLGVSFLVFAILAMMPADVAAVQLGVSATPEGIEKWNEEHGLNDPFLKRYFDYMGGLLTGDPGVSWSSNTPIKTEFVQRIPSTMALTAGTIVLVILLGVPVGVISAIRQYSIFDNISRLLAMLLTSLPAFWLGLLLMLKFALELDVLPATGGGSFAHYILPWITLSTAMAAQMIRMTRSTMLEVIRADYVQTARAKGARPVRVVMVHELRNALLPIITVVGIILGQTLGGAIVTETIFALPGVGTYLLQGIFKYDMPVVMISVLFIAAVIGVINLLIDILYMYIDPRLRSQFVKG
ncbi:MAG: ABC transporter permease [Oscillospiraceae bacterium]|nr:ABC transporter permease [Oscillospiraceae bacterium]